VRAATKIRLRLAAVGVALLVLAVSTLLPGGPGQVASAAPGAPAFTATNTVTRSHLNADGSSTAVDTKSVTLSVSQTQALRGRQQVEVTWSGAHQTGGLISDPNSASAAEQEYPVVLLECRGLDSPSAPPGQRLNPSTCWTRTPEDRYLASYSTAFPAWRTDRYAEPAERHSVVSAPDPSVCVTGGLAQRFVPFTSAAGTTFHYGPTGVCGMPPEGVTVEDTAAPPTNNTYGSTGPDGKGSAKFVVWTAAEHSSLGCSNTVPCALVAIPIMGISCDVTAASLPVEDRPAAGDEAAKARADCTAAGRYKPGAPATTPGDFSTFDLAASGLLWWSASNWRNRITVPLTFGPPANVCDLVDTRAPLSVYGSEPAGRATAQWAAAFCQDPTKYKLQHVRTGEPQAKSALAAGTVPAALISRPPDGGYATPTVNAPIAVTGFAVTYAIDDPKGNQYPNLRLTPRLLAKLLSESYWSLEAVKIALGNLPANDPRRALLRNPRDMSLDPEFMALNPGINTTQQVQSAASLLALSGNADTMYALSSYLNTDPEARAFLDGTPDPWGMVVNPKYRNLALPRETWPLLDDLPMPLVQDSDTAVCLNTATNDVQNIPIMPLIAAPVANLGIIALTMQFAIANSSASHCVPPSVELRNPAGHRYGGSFKPQGRQPPGSRFVLGLTSLGDAEYLGLTPALLQSDASDVGAKFTNGNGRHFVAPTNQSLAKAMSLATGDSTTHTWPIPYGKLRTAAGAGAYPGTMVVYAAVPTTGLDSLVAAQLGKLLRFAAGPGQQQGFDPGQVPPGFLPMTVANGLGGLAAYTVEAAAAVEAQKGATQHAPPPPDGGLGSGPGGGAGGGVPNPGAALPSASGQASLAPYKPPVEMVSYTRATVSSLAGWAMPVVVLVGLLAIAVAVLTPTGTVLRMTSSIRARLKILAELRSRS
jgi:hypothetical protein